MKKIAVVAVLMVIMIFGVVAYSYAAPNTTAAGTVAVSATVGPKVEITVPGTLDLGEIAPDESASGALAVSVRSNKAYTITRGIVQTPGMTVSGIVIPASFAKTPANGNPDVWTDTLTAAVNWTATAGTPLTSNVTYTAAQ